MYFTTIYLPQSTQYIIILKRVLKVPFVFEKMSKTNFDRERESEISCNSNDESSEGSYQNYRRGSLPKRYTPYKETRQVNENEYDGYDPNYEGAETPDRDRNEKTCCDIGRLSFVTVHSMLESVITELNFLKIFLTK